MKANEKTIHIISLSIPWPPDYGGAIDMWYKIEAFYNAGISIILHCYEYDRSPSPILQKYCEKVYYYPRKKRFRDFLSSVPFIVKSRQNPEIEKNLRRDNYPILIEGIHSAWLTKRPALQNRNIWIRSHNVEFEYYRNLSRAEKKWKRKIFFFIESLKLKHYEKTPLKISGMFCIAKNDYSFFNAIYNNCYFIGPFHGQNEIQTKPGRGKYLLYHGNLSVAENQRNALFLARLSSFFHLPLIIAGKSGSKSFIKKLNHYQDVHLQTNLSHEDMDNLLREAAVILLPAIQTTGFRLKLLISLFKGRHIVADPRVVIGTGLEHLVHLVNTDNEWIETINDLSAQPMNKKEINQRLSTLKTFSDGKNAQAMISNIF